MISVFIPVKIKAINGAKVPKYETSGAAGFDLASTEYHNIGPGQTILVSTGLFMEIPEGYELQIRPRSGVSAKTDLRIANAPGTIDSDYRGEIKIIVTNHSSTSYFMIEKDDRIAQGVLAPVYQARFVEVTELSETERGEGGFGSTGSSVV